MRLMVKFLMAGIICAVLSGCGTLNFFKKDNTADAASATQTKNNTANTTTENQLTVTIQAQANINPNSNDQPSPLVIVIYQLNTITAFNMADFFSLYQAAKTNLADSLLDQQQLVVTPNQAQTIVIKLAAGAQYLGVIGAYSDISHADWRSSLKITANTNYQILINKSSVIIKEAK